MNVRIAYYDDDEWWPVCTWEAPTERHHSNSRPVCAQRLSLRARTNALAHTETSCLSATASSSASIKSAEREATENQVLCRENGSVKDKRYSGRDACNNLPLLRMHVQLRKLTLVKQSDALKETGR